MRNKGKYAFNYRTEVEKPLMKIEIEHFLSIINKLREYELKECKEHYGSMDNSVKGKRDRRS